MSLQTPIGSCCSRPRFNAVGGVDDGAWIWNLNDSNLIIGARKVDRTTAVTAIASIVAVLAVICAWALSLLSN
jgi:hypothetical protein